MTFPYYYEARTAYGNFKIVLHKIDSTLEKWPKWTWYAINDYQAKKIRQAGNTSEVIDEITENIKRNLTVTT